MSIGKTFISYDYGKNFLLSDDSGYVDTFKSPKPVTLSISFIPPGSRQTIKAVITFNRLLDTTEEFNLSNVSGVFRYDGDEELDGSYICLDRGYEDSYSIFCEMAFSSFSPAQLDAFEYSYISGTRVVGVNGINVDDFSIEEENNYPTPIETSVSITGPKVEVLVTFNKELNTSISCDTSVFSINYNSNIYNVISCGYVSSTGLLITGNYSSSGGSNFLSYQSEDPYTTGSLVGTNGVLVRTFKITL